MHSSDLWALAAAGTAGLAVALLLGQPLAVHARSATPNRRLAPGWWALVRGRADAMPWGPRIGLGLSAGIAAGWALHSVAPAGVLAGPIVAGLAIVVVGRLEPQRARRRKRMLVRDAPAVLDLLSICIAAGLPPRSALAAVTDASDGPVAEDLGTVLALVELGVGDADAWRTLASHEQLGSAAAELARSVESGTRMAETLAQLADEARAERASQIEVTARRVGVRSVLPLMTCFIPAFLLLGIVPTLVSAVLTAIQL